MLRQIGVKTYAEYFWLCSESALFFKSAFQVIESPPYGFKEVKTSEGTHKPVFFSDPYETEGGYPCLCLTEGSPVLEARTQLLETFGEAKGTIRQTYRLRRAGKPFGEPLFKEMFKAGLTFSIDQEGFTFGEDALSKEPLTLVEACDTFLLAHYLISKKTLHPSAFGKYLTLKIKGDIYEEHSVNVSSNPSNPYLPCLRTLQSTASKG